MKSYRYLNRAIYSGNRGGFTEYKLFQLGLKECIGVDPSEQQAISMEQNMGKGTESFKVGECSRGRELNRATV